MSETPGVSDSTQNASGGSEQELKNQYEQDKHDGIAYDTYKRTVSQYKTASAENTELKSKLRELEDERLESQGKKDEVIASLRQRLSESEAKRKQDRESYTWNVVGAQVKAELAAKGVKNPDKAFKYARAAHENDLKTLEVNENFEVSKEDLSRFADSFLNDNQDMGFVSRVGVDDITPGRVEITKDGDKPTSKMSDDELAKAWTSLG